MEPKLKEDDFNAILVEYEKFVNKKLFNNIDDREDIAHEIVFQAYLELKRRVGYEGDIMDYLRRCYFNLYKRARHAHYKLKSPLPADKIINFDDYAAGMEDHLYFLNKDWLPDTFENKPADYYTAIMEAYEQICIVLTPRQLKVFEYIIDCGPRSDVEIRKTLGYTSEAGFRQIIHRIRSKIHEQITRY